MLTKAMKSDTELTDADFEKISHLVYELCGINLSDGKKELVKARLGKRLRTGQFKLVNAVTTACPRTMGGDTAAQAGCPGQPYGPRATSRAWFGLQ